MIKRIGNVFEKECIESILKLPKVKEAKERIEIRGKGSEYFNVDATPEILSHLHANMGLDLAVTRIPMRWIKGDTVPHIDTGAQSFNTTHLVYLTESPGSLIIHGDSYPIRQGCGFTFSEGLSHATTGTGNEPRLLLGPLNDEGFPVGISGIYADGQTDTVYVKQESGNIYGRINSGDWFQTFFPCLITNANPDYRLKVFFTTNFTITNVNEYFVCGSSGIQFGSTSLNSDGSRPVITINTINYEGFIQNGDEYSPGYSNIYVYNLTVDGTGGTLEIGGGWLCKKWFGNGSTSNYIVNCSSSGNLPGGSTGSGGIVGAFAGKSTNSQLYIYGCSSTGNTGQLDGGIVGGYAGLEGGQVYCENCWSEGEISGVGAGGIFGEYAGLQGATYATNCYSLGAIGNSGGGIFGRYPGQQGEAYANQCYSRGNIGTDAGGIFSIGAGSTSGTTSAINCYSAGVVTTSGTGIYGSSRINGTITNCYVANGSWSTSAAAAVLSGVPSGADTVGTTWVAYQVNEPYELNGMGYTPYTLNIIDPTTSRLITTYTQSIRPGQMSIESITADASGNTIEILKKANGNTESYSTITINTQTGIISTTSTTLPGMYILTIRSVGSYAITVFTLTVLPEIAVINSQNPNFINVGYRVKYTIEEGQYMSTNASYTNKKQFGTYENYLKYRMANKMTGSV